MTDEVLARARSKRAQLTVEGTSLWYSEWVGVGRIVPDVAEVINGEVFSHDSVVVGQSLAQLAAIFGAVLFLAGRRDVVDSHRGRSGRRTRLVSGSVQSVVVSLTTVLPFSVDVRCGAIGILATLYELCFQLRVDVGKVNDKYGPVRGFVSACTVMAVEDAHMIWRVVGPELLEVLSYNVLTMTRVV